MITLLEILFMVLFGAASLSIARLHQQSSERDQTIAWALGGACTLAIIGSLTYQRDAFALFRALGSSVALGLLPLSARLLYREGIDLIDGVIAAFTGFVLGVTSWGLAWKVMLIAVAVAGTIAMADLLRADRTTRVSFGHILATLAVVAVAPGVLRA